MDLSRVRCDGPSRPHHRDARPAEREQRCCDRRLPTRAALCLYPAFREQGSENTAEPDSNPSRGGWRRGARRTQRGGNAAWVSESLGYRMGISAISGPATGSVVQTMVESGTRWLLPLAPARVTVTAKVAVGQVDLTYQLEVLSYYGIIAGNGANTEA